MSHHQTSRYISTVDGCSVVDNLQFVISSDPLVPNSCTSPCTKQVRAPASGQCTVSGNYKFDVQAITTINPSYAVSVGVVSGCASGADTSGDNVVSWTEINSAVGNWLSGSISWGDINSGVGEWLQGC